MSSRDARRRRTRSDDGVVLPSVLVVVVLAALIVVPLLDYSVSVFRFGAAQDERADAIARAEGGIWVALSNESNLFETCGITGLAIPSSLDGVDIDCTVLDSWPRFPIAEVPFTAATVQVGSALPSGVAGSYSNPNTAADPAAWIADTSATREQGKVWLPEIPPPPDISDANNDTTMPAGAQNAGFSSCRVFFPGVFDSRIEIDGPAFFVSGVYYFTEPIVLRDGANVVVGDHANRGTNRGCTTDALSRNAQPLPATLTASGLGGTFVFGGAARLIVEDDPAVTKPIRFVMNERFEQVDENGLTPSAGLSIISVNGAHAPLPAAQPLGSDFVVPGTIVVPSFTVSGSTSDETDAKFEPSVHTARPGPPDQAPANVTIEARRAPASTPGRPGRLVVSWDPVDGNGASVTGYTVTASIPGETETCSPAPPAQLDAPVATTCTVQGLRPGREYTVTVSAETVFGQSPESAAIQAPRTAGTPRLAPPSAPQAPVVAAEYDDGVRVEWSASADDGGNPILGYDVTATPVLGGADVTCTAAWNELGCVLPIVPDLASPAAYDISVTARHGEGVSPAATIAGPVLIGTAPTAGPAPVAVVPQPATRKATPILHLVQPPGSNLTIDIDGYVSVPQGRVLVDTPAKDQASVRFTRGLLAGEVDLPNIPKDFTIRYSNPIGQKFARLVSTASGSPGAVTTAIVRLNPSATAIESRSTR